MLDIMAYVWFVLACFFAWRVWLYRKTLQEATEVVEDLQNSNQTLTEAAKLKEEELTRLTQQVETSRHERHQWDAQYKEHQQTVGILAKQWETAQAKQEQLNQQLQSARSDVERYKQLMQQAQHEAEATIEAFKMEFEQRWHEATEQVQAAEQEAAHILEAAQQKAQQLSEDVAKMRKEKLLLERALVTLEQEVETLRLAQKTAHATVDQTPVPGGKMMKAITRQLGTQPKPAPDALRPEESDAETTTTETLVTDASVAHDDDHEDRQDALLSPPSFPSAGVATRSPNIVRPITTTAPPTRQHTEAAPPPATPQKPAPSPHQIRSQRSRLVSAKSSGNPT